MAELAEQWLPWVLAAITFFVVGSLLTLALAALRLAYHLPQLLFVLGRIGQELEQLRKPVEPGPISFAELFRQRGGQPYRWSATEPRWPAQGETDGP